MGLEDSIATGSINLSAIVSVSSNFTDNIGFMDGSQRLPDYNTYQPFSYTIETPVRVEKFEGLVKTLLHPAGMKMITKYVIEDSQTLTTTGKQELN